MNSEGLKQFLATVGDAVHSVNTICVGLTSVRSGTIEKPEDLTISWSSSDPATSASKARLFALRASLVFVEEALLKYLGFLKSCIFADDKLRKALSTEKAADKVIEVSKHLPNAEPYWCPMVVLLVRWRNRVVHSSNVGLTVNQKKLLIDNAQLLKDRHAGIDIDKTINNFGSGQITLKDFTTLIAITVRYVRHIDEELKPNIYTVDGFFNWLEQRDLIGAYNSVINANGEATRRRKLKAFINTEFSDISDELIERLFKHGPVRL
ncbi:MULTISPECIES: hypothetical protein [Cobetia]|uniref:hypothetical protein n=1 Tax=Cobetia TaxID=204286 RepID=UPI000D416485|nr:MULTISPECIES: hypothetical protein [Cobetia]POR08677.1 hypothetical protein BOH68_03690 [Cobetia sp. MM1IDA2H-1]